MEKRGASISLFLILALAIAMTGILFYFIDASSRGNDPRNSVMQSINLDTEYNSLGVHVQGCLAEKTRKGIEEYGLKWTSEGKIEQLILAELDECIDFPYFENRGSEITRGTPTVDVKITDDAVTSDLNYPLALTVKQEIATAERFEYNLKREKQLLQGASPSNAEDHRLITEDFRAELIVPVGAKPSDASGLEADEPISINVLDRNFNALSNKIIVGNTVYDLGPDGARFDEPIKLKLRYDRSKLPSEADETDLRIVWYDETAGIWKAIPTEIDADNMMLEADIYHFSIYGVGYGCAAINMQQDSINEVQMQETIFVQLCGTFEEGAGTCQAVTNERTWSDSEQIAGLLEKAYNDKAPIIRGQNPYSPIGQIPHTAGVSLLDWDLDDQSKETIGQVKISPVSCQELDFKVACLESCSSQAKESFGELEDRFFSSDSLKDGASMECSGTTEIVSGSEVCKEVVCSQKEVATPMTYGYKDEGQASAGSGKTLAGGWGVLFFSLAGEGDSCIAESGEFGEDSSVLEKISISLAGSSEGQASAGASPVCANPSGNSIESCENFQTEEDVVVKQVLYNPTNKIEGGKVIGLEESPEKDLGIQAGQNGIYLRVENLDEANPNGCVWAEAGLKLWGTGITPGLLDTELDTYSDMVGSGGFGYTYGGTGTEGWIDCVSTPGGSGLSDLSSSCAEPGTDPEKDSDTDFCTDWEISLTAEQTAFLIAETAAEKWEDIDPEIRSEFEKSGLDSEGFQKLMIAIAMQESSLSHCSVSSKVKSGEGGSSVGLMQVPKSKEAYRIINNIELGIDQLIGKFTMANCRDGYTLDCTETCEDMGEDSCEDEQETYSGWRCAVMGYNGWDCRYKIAEGTYKYCGPNCNGYLENVSYHKEQIKDIPKCTGSTSSPGTSLVTCTTTTPTTVPGTPNIITIPSNPIGGIPITPGGNSAIAQEALKYLGCKYSKGPAMGTNAQNCRQPYYGFTCATFVSQAIKDACGFWLYGHGKDKCSDPRYTSSVSLGQIQPGDIFSWSDWTYGHTGIFIGKKGNDYVFMDAWPGAGVRYVTLSQLMAQNSNIRFCRIKNC